MFGGFGIWKRDGLYDICLRVIRVLDSADGVVHRGIWPWWVNSLVVAVGQLD